MRAELAPFGVSVVLVEPGVTDTLLTMLPGRFGDRIKTRITSG
jgi:hypothetical protein